MIKCHTNVVNARRWRAGGASVGCFAAGAAAVRARCGSDRHASRRVGHAAPTNRSLTKVNAAPCRAGGGRGPRMLSASKQLPSAFLFLLLILGLCAAFVFDAVHLRCIQAHVHSVSSSCSSLSSSAALSPLPACPPLATRASP